MFVAHPVVSAGSTGSGQGIRLAPPAGQRTARREPPLPPWPCRTLDRGVKHHEHEATLPGIFSGLSYRRTSRRAGAAFRGWQHRVRGRFRPPALRDGGRLRRGSTRLGPSAPRSHLSGPGELVGRTPDLHQQRHQRDAGEGPVAPPTSGWMSCSPEASTRLSGPGSGIRDSKATSASSAETRTSTSPAPSGDWEPDGSSATRWPGARPCSSPPGSNTTGRRGSAATTRPTARTATTCIRVRTSTTETPTTRFTNRRCDP